MIESGRTEGPTIVVLLFREIDTAVIPWVAVALSRDSIDTREAREALDDACLKKEPGELDWFLRRSRKDDMEEMLPGLRNFSNNEPRSLTSSPKVDLVGESVPSGAGACCRSLELKNGKLSSNESDFGRGMAPLTVAASKP